MEYKFSNVAAGTYTLKVMKENHVTREYTVVVGTDDVTQDVEIYLKGDADGDGIVSISDVTALLDYLADSANVPACGEDGLDVDGDETVNISDVTALLDILASSAE